MIVVVETTSLVQECEALARELRNEFRVHFWNVSRIMDCVDCDKCRLWGKLQVGICDVKL